MRDQQVEVAVAVEIGEDSAAGIALPHRRKGPVDPEPGRAAQQQAIGRDLRRAAGPEMEEAVPRQVLVEAADEQVGPAVAVDVGGGGGVDEHAEQWIPQPLRLGLLLEGDRLRRRRQRRAEGEGGNGEGVAGLAERRSLYS